jgi:hypothetical protein
MPSTLHVTPPVGSEFVKAAERLSVNAAIRGDRVEAMYAVALADALPPPAALQVRV